MEESKSFSVNQTRSDYYDSGYSCTSTQSKYRYLYLSILCKGAYMNNSVFCIPTKYVCIYFIFSFPYLL